MAEYTENSLLKHDDNIGARPWFTLAPGPPGPPGRPTLTKENLNLQPIVSNYKSAVTVICSFSPKVSFSTNTQILQDKPDTWFSLRVVEAECTRSQTANQVPCKHPLRLTSHHCHSSKRILILAVATAERSAWRRCGRIGTITAVSREVLLRRAVRTARRVRWCYISVRWGFVCEFFSFVSH